MNGINEREEKIERLATEAIKVINSGINARILGCVWASVLAGKIRPEEVVERFVYTSAIIATLIATGRLAVMRREDDAGVPKSQD